MKIILTRTAASSNAVPVDPNRKPEIMTLETLTAIIDHYKKLSAACNKAADAGCLDPNGPLFDAIWRAWSMWVDTTEHADLIDWYVYDNECGRKMLTMNVDGVDYAIGNVKQLHKVIVLMAGKSPWDEPITRTD